MKNTVEEFELYRTNEIDLLLEEEFAQFIDHNRAYSIIDLIASYQLAPDFMKENFQTWKFIRESAGWKVIVKDGHIKLLLKTEVKLPKFGFTELRIWVVDNKILLLSSIGPNVISGIIS
jgi:hypothetical protein